MATVRVRGVPEAKAAFQRIPPVTREQLAKANETTASEIARGAKANLVASPAVRTRALLNAIAWRVRSNGNAIVGVTSGSTAIQTAANFARGIIAGRKVKVKGVLVGNRLIRPSRYAHLVEFGTSHSRAEPFMRPAVEAEKAPHLDRVRRVGKAIEQDLSRRGGGLL